MRLLLLHSPYWRPDGIAAALGSAPVEIREVWPLDARGGERRPAVFVLDPQAREQIAPAALGALPDAGIAIVALGAPGETELPDALAEAPLSAFVSAPVAPRRLLLALRTAFREAAARSDARLARLETAVRTSEVSELSDIGIRLLTERDHDALLTLILAQARRITQSDAGSLYLVESGEEGTRRLRFKLSQNDSHPDLPFAESTLPLDHTSLAGHAAASGEPIVVDDVYELDSDVPYRFNRSFDARSGYRTKSVLVIPMSDHRGNVIGVLQLLNRKMHPDARLASGDDVEREVLPFSPHTVRLVRSLAGQAAVSLENNQLYQSIERLFEGFVRAAVTAIEQRDPSTSGHSERVADLTVALAETVHATATGPYRDARFLPDQLRELRYAALLHDFGKVGVREEVLVKPKKLYAADLALIRQRHEFLVRTAQWEYERARADHLERHGTAAYPAVRAELEARLEEQLARYRRLLAMVEACNEPTVVPGSDFAALEALRALEALARQTYVALDGAHHPLLGERETRLLSIRRGNLDPDERLEIESHVAHTYTFLRRIPWTDELARIPEIAHAHHELLDGSGYPRRIRGDDIPVQTRMMTIADMFDALTAADRPYKKAVPVAHALEILAGEVRAGLLDAELVRLFIEARLFERSRPPAGEGS